MSLNILIWNSNGLHQHEREFKNYLIEASIDVALISETHFTQRSFIRPPNHNIYNTNHPSGAGHGGTAVIIHKNIKVIRDEHYRKPHIQSTIVTIMDRDGPMNLAAVYCPPRYTNSKEEYKEFLKTLGNRFIAGGDFNSKHEAWGSRLTNTKGRILIEALTTLNTNFISSGEPT